AADPEEERRHPGGSQEARIEQAAPAVWRARRTVLRGGVLVVLGDRGHCPFFSAQAWNASGCITITRERMSAWPSPQSSVQMSGYVPTLFGVMCNVGWRPGTRSC